jgi:exodeoxyribonuclease VII large subunit
MDPSSLIPNRDIATPVREVYTVARLNREVKALLEGGFPSIWVEGEISNLVRPSSGHMYFSLKDAQAQVRCALFRQQQRELGFTPKDGMQVVARARVSLYEGRGDYQLIVEHLEEAGEGALRRAFEALKQRLSKEGLFERAHKKPLPRLPKRIGVITSPTGAALRDIVTTLRRRFPAIGVRLYPVPVQGQGAAEKIAAAIALAARQGDCDALIVARGGGSLEDLWPFNEEIVARAIHACPIPIVSGVGHETDFTIADLVADARAPTPTAAAEMLSPDQAEWLAAFAALQARLARLMRERVTNEQQRLDWLSARLLHPRERIARLRQHLRELVMRLRLSQTGLVNSYNTRLLTVAGRLLRRAPMGRVRELALGFKHQSARLAGAMRHSLEQHRQRLQLTAQALNTLSPLATLERGYAIVRRADTGAVLRDAGQVRRGERIEARLARGRLDCVVEDLKKDD